ncbi:deoxycytidylate deaminase [Ileibacterium valens]|uniref:deoxycytidylate deaminase n=1 Tax=Ileibacterium valens TaxID=1862668 RepID=UPI002354B252|nr:dCMP deaminase family protein [Ileibacterium valens]
MDRIGHVLDWDQYFMAMAHLAAFRSKDPNTKVGACIVNPQKRVVGLGYNGFPRGCSDHSYPWGREGNFLDTKYPYVVHAELNAILNSIQNLTDCTIYVSLFPCHECAKAIIQSGISTVIYESDKYDGTEDNIASKRMFQSAGVKLIQLPYQVDIQAEVIGDDQLIRKVSSTQEIQSCCCIDD